jgi:hypothetical protein
MSTASNCRICGAELLDDSERNEGTCFAGLEGTRHRHKKFHELVARDEDGICRMLREVGEPVTRRNYITFAWLDSTYQPSPEEEAEMPNFLRRSEFQERAEEDE